MLCKQHFLNPKDLKLWGEVCATLLEHIVVLQLKRPVRTNRSLTIKTDILY